MRRLVYGAVLLSLMTAVGGCRRAATAVNVDSNESTQAFAWKLRRDTFKAMMEVSLDSPRIVVEYIDSPRRLVTATARRAVAREKVAAVSNEKSETALEAISDVKVEKREESPSRWRLWWLGLIAVVGAYLLGRFRRHTS